MFFVLEVFCVNGNMYVKGMIGFVYSRSYFVEREV